MQILSDSVDVTAAVVTCDDIANAYNTRSSLNTTSRYLKRYPLYLSRHAETGQWVTPSQTTPVIITQTNTRREKQETSYCFKTGTLCVILAISWVWKRKWSNKRVLTSLLCCSSMELRSSINGTRSSSSILPRDSADLAALLSTLSRGEEF